MNKNNALEILTLLSALESWSFSSDHLLPDYLHERLASAIELLTSVVIGDQPS